MAWSLSEQALGRWWIDDDPEQKLSGTLTTSGDHELRVLGSFRKITLDGDPPHVIRGFCDGRFITLLEVTERFDVPALASSGPSTYYCPIVLVGHRDLTGTPTTFDQVDVRLTRMPTFASRSGITDEELDDTSVLRFHPLTSLRAVDDRGRTYQLDGDFTDDYSGPGRGVSWTEHENLLVGLPAALPVTQILRTVVRPLRHLLHLACGYPSGVDDLRVALSPATLGEPAAWHTVRLFQRHPDPGEDTPSPDGGCLLSLADIAFETVLPAWMRLAEALDISLDLLLSIDGPHSGFVSNRFFSSSAAAEGIHRRLNPERELPSANHAARVQAVLSAVQDTELNEWVRRKLQGSHRLDMSSRLRMLHKKARPAIDPYIPNPDKWSTAIVRMRDSVAHSLPDEDREPRVFYRLGTSIDLVVRIVLLRRIGLDPDVLASRLVNSLQWAYLQDALRSDVPEIF